jgi:hypothetical protein
MEISMRVNLKKIFMTVKELMFGKVEPFTKENIKKEKKHGFGILHSNG